MFHTFAYIMGLQSIYAGLLLVFILLSLINGNLRFGLILFAAVVLILRIAMFPIKKALEDFANNSMVILAFFYLASKVADSHILFRWVCYLSIISLPLNILFPGVFMRNAEMMCRRYIAN